MSNLLSVQPPFSVFADKDGTPLEDGYIWLGAANQSPLTNPINVYWDASLTQPAGQPIRTRGGYPSNNGTPAALYVNDDYSIYVTNKNGVPAYSSPSATGRYSDVVVQVDAQNVTYTPPFTGSVQTNVEVALSRFPSITDFGASPSAAPLQNAAAIQAALSSGVPYLTVPDAIFDCGNTVLFIDHNNLTLIGLGVPSVDKSSNTFSSGPVIKATISSNGNDSISIKNIGFDTIASSLTEGIVIVNCRDVSLENVTVIGSSTNNHCALIENVSSVSVNGFTSYGGIQAFAIKAVDFFVNDVTSYDTLTYGFTARYSPGAPCNNGFINNVNCQTNLLAKSGGFILMNDQSGAALSDIIVNNVIVDNCNNGIYITNTGNATKATRIKFSNVILRNINAFAFQTFGDVDSISIDGIEFENCSGTIFTNQATGTTRLTVSNLKQSNNALAVVSGSGHIFSGWEKGVTGGFFGENTSSELQYFDMDVTVATPFVNITDLSGTGTIARKVEYPDDISIPVNGLLYPTRLKANRTVIIANAYNQNDESTLFTLSGQYDNVAEITICLLTSIGRFGAKYLICGTTVTVLGAEFGSANVFDIVLSGLDVKFKYLWPTTSAVYGDVIYSVFGEDA